MSGSVSLFQQTFYGMCCNSTKENSIYLHLFIHSKIKNTADINSAAQYAVKPFQTSADSDTLSGGYSTPVRNSDNTSADVSKWETKIQSEKVCGPEKRSQYSDSLRAGRSGIESR
jgi:hypothetical protein